MAHNANGGATLDASEPSKAAVDGMAISATVTKKKGIGMKH